MANHTTAQNNGFLEQIIHNLKKKLISRKDRQNNTIEQEMVTFTYYSPLIQKVTNLFRQTNLNISFRATNAIYQQLTDKPTNTSQWNISTQMQYM